MHKISKFKTVDLAIEKVYEIVINIESYSEFLPWCKKIKVISKNEETNEIFAEVWISYMSFNEVYRCSIKTVLEGEDYRIIIEAIDGPFKFLYSFWDLKKISENQTNVHFEIEFEFKSFIMNKSSSIWLDYAKNKIIAALEKKLAVA